MIALILAAALLALPQPATPLPSPSATPVPRRAEAPRYQTLTDEENWKSFCSPANRTTDPLDAFKCLPLGSDANRYLTIGGDLRFKYEHFFNKDWNASNSGYLLERELLDFDLHEDRLRAFVEFEHANATDVHAPVDATWRDDFATDSAYLEYGIGGSTATVARDAPLTLRIGRQRLTYGSQRMIDDRSGLNTIAPFDGIRARVRTGAWQTDLFAMRPVAVSNFGFDDLADRKKSLLGAYATRHMGASVLDIYGLVDRRDAQFYYRGVGPEVRDTIGVRYATSSNSFDSDTEIDKQYGSFANATIDAYAVETNVGYDFGSGFDRFRIGAGGGIASGDRDPKSSRFSLFRAPYPTGLTFGIIEANGNENTAGFTPNATFTYHRKVVVALKDYFFYRQSTADGVYSAPGFPLRAPEGSTASPLGNLGYVSVVDVLDRHVTAYGAYARYLIGPFFEQAPQSKGMPSAGTAYYNLWFDVKL